MSSAAIPGMSQSLQLYNGSGSSPAISSNEKQSRRPIPLRPIELHAVFSFLGLQDLNRVEGTNRAFRAAIGFLSGIRCQAFFPKTEFNSVSPGNVSYDEMGQFNKNILDSVLPANLSYKEILPFMIQNILDERVYERYIGKVEPLPQTAKENFLKMFTQPDPCDPTRPIGKAYVLMQIPSYIEIDRGDFSLSKPDDPNDPQAPRLIIRDANVEVQSESATLKVPMTLNNIIELFKHPKTGEPSTCKALTEIVEQHGDARIPAGCVYMRKNVIGKGLEVVDQQNLATKNGVVITPLFHRVLFNFLERVRCEREKAFYPDERCSAARTSTLRDNRNDPFNNDMVLRLICGNDGVDPEQQLTVNYDCYRGFAEKNHGVAVALPMKI